MFSTLYQIAKNTFRESVREPIYLLVLLSTLCLIGIFPVFTLFVFREQVKLVVDSAMATMLVLGWVVAVLCASHAIAREIDNGTALLLLSKPVRRPVFIVAKILGILLALAVFCLLTSLATLITIRVAKDEFRLDYTVFAIYFGSLALSFLIGGIHNYVTRASFPMATVVAMLVVFPVVTVVIYFLHTGAKGAQHGLDLQTVPALILILYAVWAMGSLATALSTRLGLVANLLVCSVIFVVGLMSDYVLGRHVRQPWSYTVPRGRETAWVSSYKFDPTQQSDVGNWSLPVKADGGSTFVVWSDKEIPGRLPQVSDNPKETWQDNADWKNSLRDLSESPRYMARYDSDSHTWERVALGPPRQQQLRSAAKEKPYTAYAFRRSVDRPRIPAGGTYSRPLPEPGSWIASALYACVPNWQLFWMADALAAKRAIPTAYVVLAGIYVAMVVAFFMVVAVGLFWHREVGRQVIA